MKDSLDIRRACRRLIELDFDDEAKLLEQAPAMARMLLDREWDEVNEYGDVVCSACRFIANAEGTHAQQCAWLALMKAICAR